MTFSTRTILVCLSAIAGAAGCASSAQRPERIDRATWESRATGFVQINQPTLVAQGALPLVYQMQQNGGVRIVDATTHAQLAAATLRSMDIVRITTRGVVAGESQFAGLLAADHQYSIYLEPPSHKQTENPAPQSRPAQ